MKLRSTHLNFLPGDIVVLALLSLTVNKGPLFPTPLHHALFGAVPQIRTLRFLVRRVPDTVAELSRVVFDQLLGELMGETSH